MVVNKSRDGSLQIWPRVRARKLLPSANWNAFSHNKIKIEKTNLLGFIGYKVGMASVFVKDNTPDSMTKGKKIIVPATIIECPELKIYSVRFYKDSKVIQETVVNYDDELKSIIKKPKQISHLQEPKDFEDVRVVVFSNAKKTSIKKNPDMLELALSGNKEEKLKFIKDRLNKEIHVSEVFSQGIVDVHAVSKGFGTQGPVKRFGISLKFHKSEKGVRRPGSLGPWHPARVTFRVSQMGQTGFHTRLAYNNLILETGKIIEKNINKKEGFHNYGNIKTDYLILRGSIPGVTKRAVLITSPIRPTIKQSKQKYEVLEIR